jgi:hypothetical protein
MVSIAVAIVSHWALADVRQTEELMNEYSAVGSVPFIFLY